MPPTIDYKKLQTQMRGHLRFAVIAWATATPVMYAALIVLKLNDGLPNGNWFVVAVLPIVIATLLVGGMWLAARGDLARAETRHDDP